MSSREYAIALQYVRQHYSQLYAYAQAVVLTPARLFPLGQQGQCSSDRYINISDGLKTTGDYVDCLVHELVHAKQFHNGAKMNEDAREEEAYAAGKLAAERYLTNAAPWSRR